MDKSSVRLMIQHQIRKLSDWKTKLENYWEKVILRAAPSALLTLKINDSSKWALSFVKSSFSFFFNSYMTEKGVAFLVLADKQYPQKLAFVFLQEVCEAFFVELQNTYGTSVSIDYTSKIETIESAYAF